MQEGQFDIYYVALEKVGLCHLEAGPYVSEAVARGIAAAKNLELNRERTACRYVVVRQEVSVITV